MAQQVKKALPEETVYQRKTTGTVKPALSEKPVSRKKISGTVKSALPSKPFTKLPSQKGKVKRAMSK